MNDINQFGNFFRVKKYMTKGMYVWNEYLLQYNIIYIQRTKIIPTMSLRGHYYTPVVRRTLSGDR